jgi:7-cyano-7-deazaguanine synthase
MRGVILLSGGLDSCVVATIARKECKDLHALSFLYGQSHKKEIASAKKIARYLKIEEHRLVSIDENLFSKSSLVGRPEAIPQRELEEIKEGIPSTYVPARNIVFLSYALAYAENNDLDAIFIGANAIDYSGYPDCRPEFIEAFQVLADVGTKRGVEGRKVEIKAPLLYLSKAKIIKKGVKIGAPLHLTWSCYRDRACGRCDSCLLRLKGFQESGYRDPIKYEYYPEWYKAEKLLPIA